jgi:hypothetical protein
LANSPELTDAEIEAMVERFFEERRPEEIFEFLRQAGRRVTPYVVTALNDPRAETHAWNTGNFDPNFASAVRRFCWLLDGMFPVEAVAPLTRFTRHPTFQFREDAGRALAQIATAECIEGAARAMMDEDWRVRAATRKSLERTIGDGRGDPAFFRGLFSSLAASLVRTGVEDDVVKMLVYLDRERTLALLLSPAYLSLENPNLENILQLLNCSGKRIPHEILLPLIDQLEPVIAEGRRKFEFGQALTAYALNRNTAAESRMRSWARSPNAWVAESAGAALAVLHGIGGLFDDVCAILDKEGFVGLNEPQKNFYAVWMAHAGINNGGLHQYFYNSYADHHQRGIEWLLSHGAAEHAAVLEESGGVFGSGRPPEDWEARRPIALDFSEAQRAFLDQLDKRYYASTENIEALLWVYAVDHAPEFRRA